MKKRWAEAETKTKLLPVLAQDTAPSRRQARRHPSEWGLPVQVLVEGTSSCPLVAWECSHIALGQQERGALMGQQRGTCKVQS